MTSKDIRIKKQPRTTHVRIVEFSLVDQLDCVSTFDEPTRVIERKTRLIANLLNCSEEEAERIVLNNTLEN